MKLEIDSKQKEMFEFITTELLRKYIDELIAISPARYELLSYMLKTENFLNNFIKEKARNQNTNLLRLIESLDEKIDMSEIKAEYQLAEVFRYWSRDLDVKDIQRAVLDYSIVFEGYNIGNAIPFCHEFFHSKDWALDSKDVEEITL